MTKDNISNNPLEALQEIKKVMQQSSRIFSLSGWSGVWAGAVALAGTLGFACALTDAAKLSLPDFSDFSIYKNINVENSQEYGKYNNTLIILRHIDTLFYIAVAIFILAVLGAVFFSYRKNKKHGYTVSYNDVARKLLINLMIPIGAGAVFGVSFFMEGLVHYLVPASLVFYGLALINCSKYTFTDIKYLGLLEIILGVMSLLLMRWHLWIWGLGFGVLHIVYGVSMWYKYDRK